MRIKELISFIFAEKDNLSLENRLFISSLVIGILTSIVGSLMNYFLITSITATVIPLVLTLTLLVTYYFARFKKIIKPFIIPIIVFAFFGISLIWIFNGGINGGNSITFFMILVLALSIISDREKYYILILFLALNTILYLIELLSPELIVQFKSQRERWIDIYITIIYCAIFIYLIIKFIHNNYTLERNKAEESELKYRTLIETANEGIVIIQGYYIKFLNPKMIEITGYDENDIISTKFTEFIHPDDRQLIIREIAKNANGDFVSNRYEIRILSKSNGVIWVELSGVQIDWNGEPAILNFVHDISKRKDAESNIKVNQENLNSLINNGQEAIWSVDCNFNYVIINEHFKKEYFEIFGVELKKGMNVFSGLDKENIAFWKEKYDEALSGQRVKFDFDVESNVGKNYYQVFLNPILIDNKVNGVSCLSINVNREKEVEKEIKLKNQKLTELIATKDKFFSIIAHDLRNPLGSFKQLTNMLCESYRVMEDSEKLEYLTLLKQSSNNIFTLVENLLLWSRSQNGKISFDPFDFDLYYVSSNTIKLLSPNAGNKQIQIVNQIEPNTIINADINLISTVIRNLISNSVKFTNNGGKIILNYKKENHFHLISISDNGIGMSQKLVESLFRIDMNVTNRGTNNEIGTGLGLTICKEFIEKHLGKIWVESEVGKGSTFFFSLPIK